MTAQPNRRQFIAASSAACLVASSSTVHAETDADAAKPWLRKSFKSNMFYDQRYAEKKTLAEHFAEAKTAGFDGVEMLVPLDNVTEAIAASRETGLIIDGSVGNYHWKQRHTDSDRDVRKQALANLKTGIKQTGEMGGDSMLIVPGHGNDGKEERILQRAQEAVEAALPVAEQNKVSILIENVHNRMFYDAAGGQDQTADALAEFIDRFDSPWVGVQFDIGNVAKFGDPAGWIRTLGPRIKKLDAKGYSRSQESFTKIGEGDIDWASVVDALHEINFSGWVAAEFGPSHISRLTEISKNLETHLLCSQSLARVE
ncbi:Xylose isomerase-like TIM barrel [Rubripirellula obstinata]|uniref:Xylose isomerase-like TIM barrel n=1 Tax=Rubripirellula obstinata TaxID=406547 RepID=A0A5B1CBT8_9BACT|nr:sugar phosphate isomerase/epimerase family protein [Rubripirellula obstinata]KAA1257701.1 Xylose isomerase-like TIM barrel [Rubripirellula obstinata]